LKASHVTVKNGLKSLQKVYGMAEIAQAEIVVSQEESCKPKNKQKAVILTVLKQGKLPANEHRNAKTCVCIVSLVGKKKQPNAADRVASKKPKIY